MKTLIIVLILFLVAGAAGAAGGYFFAAGRCATKENSAMSSSIQVSNKKSAEIIEHTTQVDIEEDKDVETITRIEYRDAPAGACAVRNITQYVHDLYATPEQTDIQ